MNPQDQRIASLVRKRFQKSGKSSSGTGLLEEVSPEVQEFTKSVMPLDNGEILLVVSSLSPTSWSALTTRRLVITKDGSGDTVLWENIADIVVDFSGLKSVVDAQCELSKVKVITKDKNELLAETTPGQPFIGFWNCLILAKQMGVEEARRRTLAQEQPNNP